MPNKNQLKLILQGVEGWNKWRKENPKVNVSLSKANLLGANLSKADLWEADLSGAFLSKANLDGANLSRAFISGAFLAGANLSKANLWEANLCAAYLNEANLKRANLSRAYLREADFSGADLSRAQLWGANLTEANLTGADLWGANLENATLVETNLEQAILTHCRIYGLSVWNLKGIPANESSLVITSDKESPITVDDLQVAQFIYLLLNNRNVRNVIDTMTSKAVLILGRFTDERKIILEALHSELRQRNYLPILFDFTGPQNRDITETVSTLAHMAKFVIADMTDAKSIPQELQVIVPNLPAVPVQPMLLASQREYGMFEHFKRYPWVLPTSYYQDVNEAVVSLSSTLLPQLENKVRELRKD
jgi:hypothetical protein